MFRKLHDSHGYLEVLGLENIVDVRDVSGAKFEEKSNVTNLSLEWCGQSCDGEKHRAILDAIKPHPNLKKLNIRGYGGTEFSHWVADRSLPNITEVSLSDCKHCCQLPPFGQLPSLKKLEIKDLQSVTTIASEFYGSSGTVPFVSLEILEITSLDKLQSWSFEDGTFPCLKKLVFSEFPTLKSMNFPHCLPSLKTFKIYSCPQMETLVLPMEGEKNTAFPSLETVSITECMMLKLITTHSLPSLKSFEIYNCPQMETLVLPMEGETNTAFPSLETMSINGCTMLKSITTHSLPSLKSFEIYNCPQMETLVLPKDGETNTAFPSLETMSICGCTMLKSITTHCLPSLKTFTIHSCPQMESLVLPMEGETNTAFPSLETISINGCTMLKSITTHSLPSLKSFEIYSCPQMETLVLPMEGETNTAFPSLETMSITDCTMLKSITTHSLPSLKTLEIRSCSQMGALLLPTEMEMSTAFPSLEKMDISECPNLEFSGLLPLPSSLHDLILIDCKMIIAQRMQWGLKALRTLWIWDVEDRDMESFPEEGLLPTTVVELLISDVSNLKQLNGKGLQQLTSLHTLGITRCPKLQSLPEEGLPASLQLLAVLGCDELAPRLKRDTGEDWHKISHIPLIHPEEEEKASRGRFKTFWQHISHRD